MIVQFNKFGGSGVKWAAFCAAVVGALHGTARLSSASLVTFELVPTSTTSGTISGKTVSMQADGTVQFNIEVVVHDTSGSPANDGVQSASGGLTVIFNNGLSGAFALPTLNPDGQNGFAAGLGSQAGTQITSGSNTNIGNETAFGVIPGSSASAAKANGAANDFAAFSVNSFTTGFSTATPVGNGDTTLVLGTASLAVTGASGSLQVNFIPDYQTSTPNSNIYNQIIEVDGTQYNLNGIGTSSPAGTTNGVDASNPVTIQIGAAPEPGSLGLLGVAVAGFLIRRRRTS